MSVQRFGISAVVLAFAAACAIAFLSSPGSAQQADQPFATKAATAGMEEVRLGQLAQQRGSSEAVKEFGKRMEVDHTKAGDQLRSIAQKDNMSLPGDLTHADQSTVDRLSKLSGDAFDKAFAHQMLEDHEGAVALFRREASSGQNPDMKRFAADTLPTLEDHLSHARELVRTTGAER